MAQCRPVLAVRALQCIRGKGKPFSASGNFCRGSGSLRSCHRTAVRPAAPRGRAGRDRALRQAALWCPFGGGRVPGEAGRPAGSRPKGAKPAGSAAGRWIPCGGPFFRRASSVGGGRAGGRLTAPRRWGDGAVSGVAGSHRVPQERRRGGRGTGAVEPSPRGPLWKPPGAAALSGQQSSAPVAGSGLGLGAPLTKGAESRSAVPRASACGAEEPSGWGSVPNLCPERGVSRRSSSPARH